MSPSDKDQVIVSVDDAHLDKIAEVREALQSAGMRVEESLDEVGAITGSVDSTHLESLKQVAGVSQVERSRSYQLPPPESDVQ